MGRHEERNVKCDRESEGVPMTRLAMEHRCKQRGGRAVGKRLPSRGNPYRSIMGRAGDVPAHALASHVRQQEEEERRYAQERGRRKQLECEASTPDAGSKTPEIMPAVQISAIAQHLLSTGYTPAKLANSAEFSPRQGPSLMEVIGVRQPTPKPAAPPPPPPPALRMPILDLSVVVDDAILSEAMQAPNQTLWGRLHAEGAVESARLRALWDEECRHREVTNTRADASPPW